jgi:hypothetical protein
MRVDGKGGAEDNINSEVYNPTCLKGLVQATVKNRLEFL